MGTFRQLLFNFFKRPFKNWNVENKAFRLIEKQEQAKPFIAPRHPSTVGKFEDLTKDHAEILDTQKQKDESLHNMLKGMVVNPEKTSEIISKSRGQLPEDRSVLVDDEFGYVEPGNIPDGKCTIRQSMKFIADHHSDPKKFTLLDIAKEYNLDPKQLENILKYFQTLDLHIPDSKEMQDKSRISTGGSEKQIGELPENSETVKTGR